MLKRTVVKTNLCRPKRPRLADNDGLYEVVERRSNTSVRTVSAMLECFGGAGGCQTRSPVRTPTKLAFCLNL